MLIGAAPWDSAAPVAINFLAPRAEENACRKQLTPQKNCHVMVSDHHRFYVPSICIATLVAQQKIISMRTTVVQVFLNFEGSTTHNIRPPRETTNDDRVITVDVCH